MRSINQVVYTDLFWNTLSKYRNQQCYEFMRKQIDWLISRKAESVEPVNNSDKRFSKVPYMTDIWHFKISRNPDLVVFYKVEQDALVLAAIGDHHWYPSDGKNQTAAKRTGMAIDNSIEKGNINSPLWRNFNWKMPQDIIESREISELSADVLNNLLQEILDEFQDATHYFNLNGIKIEDEEDYDKMSNWLDNLEKAQTVVQKEILNKIKTPEKNLQKVLERVCG